ncbi:MAG: ATP synthase F1 subunit epsilon [Phycisphaerae bacterium]|nr:ATP synthase F1 subunit epsilon [Phycisphaerae bacterium]MDW8261844.1 ATP synthase F1 subunit epsilon [Phycisphaerales bacterium]
MTFNCVIVTPEQQLLDESANQVIVPAHDGEMGILAHRAPMLTKIGVGRLRVDLAGGSSRSFFVEGGVAQMDENRLTVLTDHAIPVEQLTAEAVEKELSEANALPPEDPSRPAAIRRAQVKARLISR